MPTFTLDGKEVPERKPPSPHQGLILRAMREANGGWNTWDDVMAHIRARPWCRSEHMYGVGHGIEWHRSTVRSHLKELERKGWVEKKYMRLNGRKRIVFKVVT